MTHVTCRLAAKNRDQLWNRTLCNRVWVTFTFLISLQPINTKYSGDARHLWACRVTGSTCSGQFGSIESSLCCEVCTRLRNATHVTKITTWKIIRNNACGLGISRVRELVTVVSTQVVYRLSRLLAYSGRECECVGAIISEWRANVFSCVVKMSYLCTCLLLIALCSCVSSGMFVIILIKLKYMRNQWQQSNISPIHLRLRAWYCAFL